MRLMTCILLTAFAGSALADDHRPPPPKWMEGGTWVLELPNGKKFPYLVSEWKLVPRVHKEPEVVAAPAVVKIDVPQAEPERVEREVIREKEVYRKNNVTFLAGVGPNGLKTKREGDDVVIRTMEDPVLGLQYTRNLNLDLSLSLQALTNETIMGGIGVSF